MSIREVVTAYTLISKLEKLDYFNQLVMQGILPSNWKTYKEIYDFYLDEKEKEKGKQLITNVAEKFNISERSVYLIVQKMEN